MPNMRLSKVRTEMSLACPTNPAERAAGGRGSTETEMPIGCWDILVLLHQHLLQLASRRGDILAARNSRGHRNRRNPHRPNLIDIFGSDARNADFGNGDFTNRSRSILRSGHEVAGFSGTFEDRTDPDVICPI